MTATLDDRTPVTVDGTTNVLTADFGYAPPAQNPGEGLIGDSIFLDRNANNTSDAGEGLEGVTVRLYQDNGTTAGVYDAGDTLLQTTVTNENGTYLFGGLGAGSYVVQVDTATLPAGVTNTFDPGSVAPLNEAAVLLAAGGINLTHGLRLPGRRAPGTVSGDDLERPGRGRDAGRDRAGQRLGRA